MGANAAASGVLCQSVCTWVDRYLVEGLASLTDKSHRSSVCPHWVTGDAKRSDLARPAGFDPATRCLEGTREEVAVGHPMSLYAVLICGDSCWTSRGVTRSLSPLAPCLAPETD